MLERIAAELDALVQAVRQLVGGPVRGPPQAVALQQVEAGTEQVKAQARARLAETVAHADLKDGQRILELGCGATLALLAFNLHFPGRYTQRILGPLGMHDTRVDPDWLTFLVQPFLTLDVVGSGGPNIVPPDDPPIDVPDLGRSDLEFACGWVMENQ